MLLHNRATVVTRASVGPSSVKPVFSEPVSHIKTKLVERYLFTLSPDHFFFQNFCTTFFVNMGPYGRKNVKRYLLWKYIRDSHQKIMHTSREGLYQSCTKIGEIPKFGFLPFFPFLLTKTETKWQSLTWLKHGTIWEKKRLAKFRAIFFFPFFERLTW